MMKFILTSDQCMLIDWLCKYWFIAGFASRIQATNSPNWTARSSFHCLFSPA
jgi:hypothetical protein